MSKHLKWTEYNAIGEPFFIQTANIRGEGPHAFLQGIDENDARIIRQHNIETCFFGPPSKTVPRVKRAAQRIVNLRPTN